MSGWIHGCCIFCRLRAMIPRIISGSQDWTSNPESLTSEVRWEWYCFAALVNLHKKWWKFSLWLLMFIFIALLKSSKELELRFCVNILLIIQIVSFFMKLHLRWRKLFRPFSCGMYTTAMWSLSGYAANMTWMVIISDSQCESLWILEIMSCFLWFQNSFVKNAWQKYSIGL